MSYHGTNANQYDGNRSIPAPRYRTLDTSTSRPLSKMVTINPYDNTFMQFQQASDNGHLNINYNNVVAQSTGYYGVNTGYGRDPESLYAARPCSGIYYGQEPVYGPNNPLRTGYGPSVW